MSKAVDFLKLAKYVLNRKKIQRTTEAVTDEYTDTWNAFRDKLKNSNTVEEWLNDNDGIERYYNVDGNFSKQKFDSSDFYRKTLLNALEKYYPKVKSVAEFGCGVGRNLIYLHLKHPEIKFYGFELCKPGVELANKAAEKFGFPIKYYQLDYVNWIPTDIDIPNIDVAFTNFSLEQVPDRNFEAISNMYNRVNQGTFHLEPVVENYPFTIKGIISKMDHYKVNYLQNFEKNASRLVGKKNITKIVFSTAHNPLMYPSLYILKKS